jgi:hypothetical protein
MVDKEIIKRDVESAEKMLRYHEEEMNRLYSEILKLRKVLAKRNQPLDRLLHLQMASLNLFAPVNVEYRFNPKDFEAKRGRKSKLIPIREVMHILGVSHRTAQDYVRAWMVLKMINDLMYHVKGRSFCLDTLGMCQSKE